MNSKSLKYQLNFDYKNITYLKKVCRMVGRLKETKLTIKTN